MMKSVDHENKVCGDDLRPRGIPVRDIGDQPGEVVELTTKHAVALLNPPPGYPVMPGPITANGTCHIPHAQSLNSQSHDNDAQESPR